MQRLFLYQWFSDEALKAICWTIIHSLWQGLLAALVAGVIIVGTRKSTARLRYNLLGTVLVLFVITTGITLLRLMREGVAMKGITDTDNVMTSDYSIVIERNEMAPVPAGGTLDFLVTYFNANADLIVLIWLVFFLFHCIRLVTGLATISRLKHYKTHEAGEKWGIKLNSLCESIGIRQSINLLQSEIVKVPVAIGFFKPVILVPLGLLSNLPADQVETILMHELAHIRRRDYLMNILQRFTESVFFFNPALLWISSLVRQEREACCDDIVMANTNHQGSYLEALVSFQEFSLAGSQYAMGITSKKHYLLNRVKRMLTRENKKLDVMEKMFLIMGVVIVSAFSFIPKKEAKAQQPVRQATKRAEEKTESAIATTKLPAATNLPVALVTTPINKKTVKPVSKPVVVKDSVPSPAKATPAREDLTLQSISSTVNNDGKTKTATTTVVDQHGKKYTINKLNDKVTGLSIDGNSIPESEFDKYSTLIVNIDRAVEKSRQERIKQTEIRKAEILKRRDEIRKRAEDTRIRMAEQRKERFNEDRKAREKENEKRRVESEKHRKKIQEERMDRLRSTRTIDGKGRTFLNGREVIKNPKDADIKNKADNKKQVVNEVQYKMELNKDITVNQVKVKSGINLQVTKKLLAQSIIKTDNKVLQQENKTTNEIQIKQGIEVNSKIEMKESAKPATPANKVEPSKGYKPVIKDGKKPSPADTRKIKYAPSLTIT